MNAGQMIVQMPLGSILGGAMPELSPAVPGTTGEQNAEAFAGILGELSAQAPVEVNVATGAIPTLPSRSLEMKNPEPAEEALWIHNDTMPERVVSLLATMSVPEQIPTAGKAEAPDEILEELQQADTNVPQNVELSTAGAQAVPAPLINGRMPASEQKAASQEGAPDIQEPVVQGISKKVVPTHQPMVASGEEQEQPAETIAVDMTGVRNRVTQNVEPREALAEKDEIPAHERSLSPDGRRGIPLIRTQVSEVTPLLAPEASKVIPADVAETPRQKPQKVESVEAVVQAIPQRVVRTIDQGHITVPGHVAEKSLAPSHELLKNHSSEAATTLPTADQEASGQVFSLKSGALKVEESAPLQMVSKMGISLEAAVMADKEVAVDKSVPANPAGFKFARSAAVDVALGNGHQDIQRAVDRSSDSANLDIAVQRTEMFEIPSGEPQFAFGDQKSDGFLQQGPEVPHPAAPQHPIAGPKPFTTAALSASTPLQTILDEPSRLVLQENIAGQVRERISTHDVKVGSEQIVFRLSPENLGEIKVHLRLDDQRLKVEIIAENKVAREGLIQHMDSLKESLSRQNISMDKFSVTSGESQANSQGSNNPQGEWRELARNRQSQQWLTSGGYRLPSEDSRLPQAYQGRTEHAMLDVHF